MIPLYENRRIDIDCRDSRRTGRSIKYITPHIHYHIEIVYIISGHVHAKVDNELYDVNAGDIIIVFPNQVHCYEPIECDQHIMAIVNPDLFPDFNSLFNDFIPTSNLLKHSADSEDLIDIVKQINDEYSADNPYREIVLRGYFLTLFGKLFRRIEWTSERSEDYSVLGTIMNYCTKNFERNLSLEVLEKELYISRSYISRIINTKLNMGFNDYINSIRISNACQILSNTDKSMIEISEIVGFNSLRTFNRAFAKQMKMTPRDYQMKTKVKVGLNTKTTDKNTDTTITNQFDNV